MLTDRQIIRKVRDRLSRCGIKLQVRGNTYTVFEDGSTPEQGRKFWRIENLIDFSEIMDEKRRSDPRRC